MVLSKSILAIGMRLLYGLLLSISLIGWGNAKEPSSTPTIDPSIHGIDGSRFEAFGPKIDEAIQAGDLPGAVIAIGFKDDLIFHRAYGHRQLAPTPVAMSTETLFDLASLTKPVATATSIMQLVEKGLVDLDAPVSRYLPEFSKDQQASVTVRHLLLHTSGLIPDNSLKDYQEGVETAKANLLRLQPRSIPGEEFKYSDVGFLLLGEIVNRVSHKPLDQYVRDAVFGPLGMQQTTYNPPPQLREIAAPCEQRDGDWIRGIVHDPRAFALEGVAGHAGLFSTTSDLTLYARTMLGGGKLGDARILQPETIALMTEGVEVSSGIRSLGWDKQSPYSSNRGQSMSPSAFGHGGFTGTVMWIDPELQMFFIFLSNRLHPDGVGSVNKLAGSLGTIAADAIRERARVQ